MIEYKPASKEEIIPLLYQSAMAREETNKNLKSLDVALNCADRFDIYGIYKNNKAIGGFLLLGSEIHIGIIKQYWHKWIDQGLYDFLQSQFEQRGPLLAKPAGKLSERFIKHFSNTINNTGHYILIPPFKV